MHISKPPKLPQYNINLRIIMRTLNKTIALSILLMMNLAAEAQYPGGISTNLDLWINASNLAPSGQVTSWPSMTANGYVLTDANMSAPSISTRKQNEHPVVYFDGIDDGLNLGTSTMYSNTDGMMMFYVVKPDKPVGYNDGAFVVDYGFVSNYGYGSKFGTEMYGSYANNAGTYSINNTTHKKDIISLATTQYVFSTETDPLKPANGAIRFSVDGKGIFDMLDNNSF